MNNAKFRWTGFVCAVCLVVAATAKSDTYNFYFAKPKKQSEPARVVPPKEEAAAPDDGLPPAPEYLPGEGPATSGTEAKASIVINNNNNVTVPQVSAPPPVEVATSASSEAVIQARPNEDRTHWRFGAGVLMAPGATRLDGSGAETGAVISLGLDFTRWFGVNLYTGGLVYNSGSPEMHFYGGTDLEIRPFRISIGKLDVLELGLLVGGSTVVADYENWGSLHAGGRATLSFDKHFGITVAARANLGTVLFEGGLVTRF